MPGKLTIIGYSGHSLVVCDAAMKAGLLLTHYCERTKATSNPFNLKYLGSEEDENFKGWTNNYQFILGIGDNLVRHRIALNVIAHKKELINIIHPDTSISDYFKMGTGNFISRQVSVNAMAVIGDFCILNTACIIEHGCKIGNAVHIAPGAVLAGDVEVGEFSFVGANAVIKQGVKIGSRVVIGAGSVIIKDIADNKKVIGNPGRIV